ncbi:hypothetical protein ACTXT7_002072 [Hymenolepis weldensis]
MILIESPASSFSEIFLVFRGGKTPLESIQSDEFGGLLELNSTDFITLNSSTHKKLELFREICDNSNLSECKRERIPELNKLNGLRDGSTPFFRFRVSLSSSSGRLRNDTSLPMMTVGKRYPEWVEEL